MERKDLEHVLDAARRENPNMTVQVGMSALTALLMLGGCTDARRPTTTEPAEEAVANGSPDKAGESAGDADAVAIRRLAVTASDRTPTELVQLPMRRQAHVLSACASLSWGDFYCLGLGFTDGPPKYKVLLTSSTAATSGDLTFEDWVTQRAAMPRSQRLAEQRAEAAEAISGLEKARSLASG
jgi:hypothetical protein